MCDYDSPDAAIDHRKWVTARQPHTCYACDEQIQPGHKYHLTEMLWEGEWSRYRHCARCNAMFDAIHSANRQNGITDVAIDLQLNCGEDWADNFGTLPDDVAALAFLTPEQGQALVPTEAK